MASLRVTPDAFRRACKRFIFVENLGAPPEVETQPAAPQEEPSKEAAHDAIPLVLAAMQSIDPDADWYTLGQLGQYLVSATPDFDPRTYGSAKLSDLLRKTGRFEIKQRQGNHLDVRRLD